MVTQAHAPAHSKYEAKEKRFRFYDSLPLPWDSGCDMVVSVPGRVNLIGEHIDYHDLPVLPMAIQRRVSITFEPRNDGQIQATSELYGQRLLQLNEEPAPLPPGDWGNYLVAAIRMVQARWPVSRGIDAAISSDLPSAAGLSSSSALLTGFALCLLYANAIYPTVEELMAVLPEGEQFVGTRGGGMDHAAVLASKAGCALLLRFAPLRLTHIPIPPDWAFLVAHSLTLAEKSGPVKLEYNRRRTAGVNALKKLGLINYREAIPELEVMSLDPDERGAFLHSLGESRRVESAVESLARQPDRGVWPIIIGLTREPPR